MAATPPSTPLHTLTIEKAVAEDGTPTLLCRGRFIVDTCGQLRTEVKALSPNHKLVQADMSGVDYVDSAGLGSLLGTFISAKRDGCHLELINVNRRVRDLLDLTKLAPILEDKG